MPPAFTRPLHREGQIIRFSFRKQHCHIVSKRVLDHMRPKAQVVHHSLRSMNAVPPAPVSSSWRHGLLVAKMAVAQATRKREKVRSIKSRLSPEKEAPSFLNRKAMMIIDGGFRLRQRNFSGLRQMCAAESTSVLPVEELLKHGTPLALPLREHQSNGFWMFLGVATGAKNQ